MGQGARGSRCYFLTMPRLQGPALSKLGPLKANSRGDFSARAGFQYRDPARLDAQYAGKFGGWNGGGGAGHATGQKHGLFPPPENGFYQNDQAAAGADTVQPRNAFVFRRMRRAPRLRQDQGTDGGGQPAPAGGTAQRVQG